MAPEATGSASATVRAQAKINLFLRILAHERSGYHQIETLFCRLSLCDVVRVRATGGATSLKVAGPALPPAGLGPEPENLAWRAAQAYQRVASWPQGFAIEIEKSIPVGAGLGGGSADAGAVLRALNALAPRPLDEPALLAVASSLGADVPFLTQDRVTLALAWGRGDRFLGLDPLASRECLVVVPPFAISTRDAYGWLVESRTPTAGRAWRIEDLAYWPAVAREAVNTFEPVVFSRFPELGDFVARCRTAAEVALLSGSGSAVFVVPKPGGPAPAIPTGFRLQRCSTAATIEPVVVE